MTRAAIYARNSSNVQDATSIEDQIAMARRLCAREGWTVVAVFEDREKTGRNARRPGLQSMKEAISRREIDVVVVEAIDRLARRVADALNYFDLFQFQGTELHSIQEGKQDFFRVLLLGFGAQQFSEMVSAHTRRGMQGAVTRGRLHTSAYGYRKRDVETGLNREIDEGEAEVVPRIFRETAEGRSALTIARGLNADHIPAPKGGTWDGSTIRGNKRRHEGILNNRLYVGEASVCKFGRHYHPETGEKAVFATDDDAVTEVFEELRIVPQDLWEAAHAELTKRSATATTGGNPNTARRSKHLLTGLMVCGSCGAPYVKVGQHRFGCRESRKWACDNRVTVRQDRIEARVFGQLRSRLLGPELIRTFEAAYHAELRALNGADVEMTVKTVTGQLARVR